MCWEKIRGCGYKVHNRSERQNAGLGGVKVGFLEEVRSYMDLEGHVTIYHAGEEGDAEGIPSGPRNGKVNGTDIKGNR